MHQNGCSLDSLQAADTRADQNAGAAALLFVAGHESRIGHRLLRGGQAEDDEIVDPALLLGIDPLIGIERAVTSVAQRNTAADARRQVVDFELGDRSRAGLTCEQPRPCLFNAASKRRDETQTGDDDSTHIRGVGAQHSGL
jgi:hypothetical protein